MNTLLVGLIMFTDGGIALAVVRSPRGQDPRFLDTAWTIQVLRGFLLLFVSFIFAWPAAHFYAAPQLLLLVPVMGLNLLISHTRMPRGRMTYRSCSRRFTDGGEQCALRPRSARLVPRRQEEGEATEVRLSVLSPRLGLLMLNVGTNYHVGPNRMYVTMARAWTQQGISFFRFDLGGIGDSAVADTYADTLLYSEHSVRDVKAAMDALSERRGIRRFVVMGLCSGAYVAFQTALADPRVVGQVPWSSKPAPPLRAVPR